eukprot:1711072-Rhodomonas_salina.2
MDQERKIAESVDGGTLMEGYKPLSAKQIEQEGIPIAAIGKTPEIWSLRYHSDVPTDDYIRGVKQETQDIALATEMLRKSFDLQVEMQPRLSFGFVRFTVPIAATRLHSQSIRLSINQLTFVVA